MISAYGYYWKHRRFGGVFKEQLLQFKKREEFDLEQWRDYRTIQLRKLLVHSFETVPLYNEKYKNAGFSSDKLKKFELDDLNSLPFLEKEELRKYGQSKLMSVNKDKKGAFYSSSGSTGTPTNIYYSLTFHQTWSAAFEARIRNWAGIDRFTPRGMIGGRRIIPEAKSNGPFYRYNAAEKQTYLSAYHISEKNAENYIEGIKKHNVEYMTGYAMSNYLLAQMVNELGLKTPQLKAVITSSEKLTQEMRDLFKRVYKCKTFDSYSGVEACGLISENQDGELLVSPDVGIIEVINDEKECQIEQGEGELVSTGLLNFDQPLIRYRIGDRIKMASTATKSKSQMPLVEEISGRIEDIVMGPDGRKMVRFHGVFIDITGLINAQLVQEDINWIRLRLQVNKEFDRKSELLIKNRLSSQLGEVKITFEYPETIGLNKNGKFKAVISKLKSS